ncbi:uncharacterized protein PAC_14613 [Phialocephala subalpina]|uniref:Uncharacterized protein n=1 Tax=Phialocephala subalpina TaxID=576137 RepID=A0A1L7XI61_9HELO|nr:uncharacterized protein PAC_14613 [Phialocephala subalpina]
MQLTSILTIALLALGVVAHPSAESRNAPSCPGEKVYNDAHKQCECTPDKSWDNDKQKCCHKPMPQPQCPQGQNPHCSKDKDKWCPYDQKNDYCEDNGYNSAWCCEKGKEPDKMKEKYPPQPPVCKDKQKYSCDQQKCVCPKPMWWNDQDQKCHYPAAPKPSCPVLQQPYCGKSKSNWCPYDDKNEKCENDGTCYTWCSMPSLVDSLVQSIFDL